MLTTYVYYIKCIENIYNSYGNLIKTIDHTNNASNETKVFFDKFGNTTSVYSTQHNTNVVVSNVYDSEHNKTSNTDLSIGENNNYSYTFLYDNNPDKNLQSIVLKHNNSENIFTQVLEYIQLQDSLTNKKCKEF